MHAVELGIFCIPMLNKLQRSDEPWLGSAWLSLERGENRVWRDYEVLFCSVADCDEYLRHLQHSGRSSHFLKPFFFLLITVLTFWGVLLFVFILLSIIKRHLSCIRQRERTWKTMGTIIYTAAIPTLSRTGEPTRSSDGLHIITFPARYS